MNTLIDKALRRVESKGRTYPEGYGFALTFLDDDFTPSVLKNAADDVVLAAFSIKGREQGWAAGDDDLVRYVAAISDATHWADWAIEGAQLVLQWANWERCPASLKRELKRALARCGHPGFDEE